MATTENLHNGTGSQDTFAFTFPYLKDTDIKVSVGGILKTVTTHYTLHTPTTIKFTSGNIPPSGTSNVRVYRETADTALQATFYPGSAIRSNDLNDNFTQNLYVVQENNNRVDSAWQTGDETVISTEAWHTSDDTRIATTKAIENRINAQIDTAIEADVLAGTDLTKTASGGQVTINHSVTGAASVDNSNGTVIQDLTINGRGHVTATGSVNLDGRYYTETELDAGQLDNRYYTETELNAGQLDNRYYTETEADNQYYTKTYLDSNFYKLGSVGEIQSGETWTSNDTKVATTAAIDARIVDLVDDVGGFVPIANETSFPNANPDVNNGAGTLVSVPLANNLTSNGSGIITIANGTVGNSTVTINGASNNTTYAAGFGLIVETTSTLNTYTLHRHVPKATEVTTVAGNISNITTVGGISSNVTTVAGVSANVTTVAGVASNVTTVAGIASDVTAVAADATDIGAVAGKATEIGRLGTADAVADLALLGTAAVVEDLNLLGTTAAVADMALLGDAAVIADMAIIADTSNLITNIGTVAGIQANVTTVAGDTTAINNITTNLSAVQNAATNATNAASSATAAASSATSAATSATTATTNATTATTQATTATTQATNAATSATSAASNASTATSQASTATTQASNASTSAANALSYKNLALAYRDAASAILTQSNSIAYNLSDSVSSHTSWGNITDTGTSAFADEESNTALTMAEGSATYNYGSIT